MNNLHRSPDYITEFPLFNMPVAINEKYNGQVLLAYVMSDLKELTLPHKDTALSYEFVAQYYALPVNNQYNYNMI